MAMGSQSLAFGEKVSSRQFSASMFGSLLGHWSIGVRFFTSVASAAFVAFGAASVSAQDVVPSHRIANVQWPAAGLIEPPPPHSAAIAAVIKTLKLPVLIPASFARFKTFEVVSTGPYDYTASVRIHGAKLWIDGTRQEVIAPEGAAGAQEFAPSPAAAFIEPDPPEPKLINRKVQRYGAGYVISAECVDPNDHHCTDDYLRQLEASLRIFGGAQ